MIARQGIDDLLRRATDASRIPGVVAAVRTGAGVVYEGAFGRRAIHRPAPMTPDTVFWLASLAQPITAVAAMQLVDRGLLSLDEPAARCCEELAQARVLAGFDPAGRPQLRPPRRPVTLRQLLSHTSGFGLEIWNRDLGRYQSATSTPSVMSGRVAALRLPLVADPGEAWEYGIGLDWAGRMIERATRQPLGEQLRESLFEPLGMADTGFHLDASRRGRLAKIHNRAEDGALEPTEIEMPPEPEFEQGGFGLYATVGDLLRFAGLLLRGGEIDGRRLLRPETVDAIGSNQGGALRPKPLRTAMAALSNDAGFPGNATHAWGLGFLVHEAPSAHGRSEGSLGAAGLANAFLWIDRKRQVAGVLATQILPYHDAQAVGLFEAFESAVYRALK